MKIHCLYVILFLKLAVCQFAGYLTHYYYYYYYYYYYHHHHHHTTFHVFHGSSTNMFQRHVIYEYRIFLSKLIQNKLRFFPRCRSSLCEMNQFLAVDVSG
jgi:hypothetical protein